jgi:hypothetical protein
MPAQLLSVLIAGAAIALILWLLSRVGALGTYLGTEKVPAPARKVSRSRTIVAWVAMVLAALVLLWLINYVFGGSR